MPYMAWDSSYIYALDYVDINYSSYLLMIHCHDVHDPRF
jgi:hypothetical protein